MIPIKLVLNEDRKRLRPMLKLLRTKQKLPKGHVKVSFVHVQYNIHYINRKRCKIARDKHALFVHISGIGRLKIPKDELQVVEFRNHTPTSYRVKIEIIHFPGAFLSMRIEHKDLRLNPDIVHFLLNHRPFLQ